ncbi:MAG: MmcQ/YjbR family DNA-binding protein [Clostridia bacterium]|nr:MmcQ/YjbR family DNA-binding protein [Clostridia bacterium]
MTEQPFKNRKPNPKKLLSFGFEAIDHIYLYRCTLMDGQMDLTVTVSPNGNVHTEVFDNGSGEEYVLHRVAGTAGAFVGQVKAEYEAKLGEIAQKCFDPEVFKSSQAKEIIAYVRKSYGDEPEYLWQKFPNNAIVRRKDNQKWYAALLTVSRRKLGVDSDELAEILDLRIKPEEIANTVDHIHYFPGYHMNQKHWITICLDNTVNTKEIFSRIDNSYLLALKSRR